MFFCSLEEMQWNPGCQAFDSKPSRGQNNNRIMIKNIVKLPVVLVAIFMVIMIILDAVMPGFGVDFPNQSLVTLITFAFGFVILAIGGYSFRKAKTTVNPMTPEKTTRLVTHGIYSLSRNPMYIGFLAWLIASLIFVGNIVNVLLLPLYIFLVNKLYIAPEEKAMEKLFNNEFSDYKSRVRRWI